MEIGSYSRATWMLEKPTCSATPVEPYNFAFLKSGIFTLQIIVLNWFVMKKVGPQTIIRKVHKLGRHFGMPVKVQSVVKQAANQLGKILLGKMPDAFFSMPARYSIIFLDERFLYFFIETRVFVHFRCILTMWRLLRHSRSSELIACCPALKPPKLWRAK